MTAIEFVEYIQYLSDEMIKEQKKKQEEQLFNVWLHKVYDKTYPEWKKEVLNKTNKKIKNNEKMTKEMEEKAIEKAETILGR